VNRKDGIIGGIECAHTLNASDYRGLNRNQTQNAVVEYAGENMCFIDLCKKSQLTDTARCLKARYNSGITNHKGDNSGVLVRGDFKGRIRKLTPLECFRLQGWSDEQFYRAQAVNSDNQLYKQAGNGVTVPVIYAIGQKLWEVYHAEK
jgi:DNA (cytosine-5)-methyltransferase 1